MPKYLLQILIFLIMPLLLLEAHSRLFAGHDWFETHWYLSMEKRFARCDDAIVIVGSSGAPAAIDGNYLGLLINKECKRNVTVFNMGCGYTTMAENYLAVKQLIKQRKSLKNVLFLVETVNGYPPLDTWRDSWVHDQFPTVISPYLDGPSIRKMWQSSMSLDQKLSLTLGRYVLCFRYFPRYKRTLESLPETLFPLPAEKLADEISEAAGVRNNRPYIERAREIARERYRLAQAHPSQAGTFTDDTVFNSFVKLCTENGALVCTYPAPHCSLDVRNLSSVGSTQLASAYESYCGEHDVHRLAWANDLGITDKDFPDLSHVKSSLRRPFTELLAEALVPVLSQQKTPSTAAPK